MTHGPRPALWRDIADTVRAEVARGCYRPGDKLPTEAALAARFGVNRHTVRHALAALAAEGLVHARRGAGVFVAARPAEYPLGRRVRFHEIIAATGRTPSRDIAHIETRLADAREVTALALAPGALAHVAEGVSLADGVALAAFRSTFCATRFPDLPQALRRHGSITAALRDCGLSDYTRASTRITAHPARAALAARLRLAPGAPILRAVAINVDAAGAPVEYGVTWFAGERVTLTVAPET